MLVPECSSRPLNLAAQPDATHDKRPKDLAILSVSTPHHAQQRRDDLGAHSPYIPLHQGILATPHYSNAKNARHHERRSSWGSAALCHLLRA